jgi:hypothetical protein
MARTSFTLVFASHARHADDFAARRADAALVLVDHRVERVRDDDDERVGTMLFRVVGDVSDDGEVRLDEVVARLTGLTRDARGDDEHVGALQVFPVRRTGDAAVLAEQRARLLEIERFALREAFLLRNVEEDDVAELATHHEVCELAADIACANETNFLSGHETLSLEIVSAPRVRISYRKGKDGEGFGV